MKKILKTTLLLILILGMGSWLFIKQKGMPKLSKGKAILSWAKADDSSVIAYKIYYGTSPRNGDCPDGGYEKSKEAGDVGEYVIDDLEPGKTYYFSVSALNGAKKESCFSQEMNKKIPSKVSLFFSQL